MNYQHRGLNTQINLPVGKVVCVGRNYLDHIAELNNTASEYPVIFMKPSTALCDFSQPIVLPENKGQCHNEIELAFLIEKPLKNAEIDECRQAIWGVALGLDLTLRDLQNELKAQRLPWERAKAFDGACPITPFVSLDKSHPLEFEFSLTVNNSIRQQGDSRFMIWSTLQLLSIISSEFSLLPGDIVLTGTPKGVGPLASGDQLSLCLDNLLELTTEVQ
ncbi:fumarylacetoacetate hydrolase family protein [Glaciecola sp. 1036]|uniref:fumarylacetoacetate hydrolase family protein n=1 Tax=Alteromonadaceae TaxID=72275 RepID=UPI003D063FBC